MTRAMVSHPTAVKDGVCVECVGGDYALVISVSILAASRRLHSQRTRPMMQFEVVVPELGIESDLSIGAVRAVRKGRSCWTSGVSMISAPWSPRNTHKVLFSNRLLSEMLAEWGLSVFWRMWTTAGIGEPT